MASQFSMLFQPGNIGRMTVKNRLVMAPMGTNTADENGYVTEAMIRYYEERARGGVGLIIIEGACVDPLGKSVQHEVDACDDQFIPGLKKLADAIHRHGGKVALQLHHAGRIADRSVTGQRPVGPSAIRLADYIFNPMGKDVAPRKMSIEEIAAAIKQFARAAERAKRAGFDGVELHGAHGYIISQFLSGFTNRRRDAYGGSVKNRARFLIETLQAVRDLVGADYPVWCRLNAKQYGMEHGVTLEETAQVARWAQSAGADAINVSVYGAGEQRIPLSGAPLGYLLRFSQAIKTAVSVPVIAVGRITVEVGEQALKEGKCDFVAIGKALIADPQLPNKAAAGAVQDITPCICCEKCLEEVLGNRIVRCSVNANAGRESELTLAPATQSKKLLVIGGGPAGMEAARVAALRGHKVTLYEQEPYLGGQLRMAILPPYKASIQPLIEYLKAQLDKLGVQVLTSSKVTTALVDKLAPDAVIVAAGSSPFVPEISGINNSGVVMAADALTGKAAIGEKVVIIGGERVGCETAEHLAQKGKKVVLMRRGKEIGSDLYPPARAAMLHRLKRLGVELLPGVAYKSISDNGVVVTRDGEERLIKADTVIIAAGSRSNTELYEALKTKGYAVYKIGDCVQPGNIISAISGGAAIARVL